MNIVERFLILTYLFMQTSAHAANNEQWFPIMPSFIGEVSNVPITGADAMVPIYGNENQLWFINGVGAYGNHSSTLVSVGGGLRTILANNALIGGYFFTDWDKTRYGNDFWVLNPGIEWMNPQWDIHVNAYIPTENKKLLNRYIASSIGNNRFLKFHQHTQIDNILASYDIIGKGVDGEIGFSIPRDQNTIRFFAGSYFYIPPNVSHITGIQVGMKFPLRQHTNLVVQDSYDNVFYNTAIISIQFTLGGLTQTRAHPLQERMLDPIPRHLGSLNTGAGILDQKQQQNTGQQVMVDSNLWFFQPGTGNLSQTITSNSCTFEHPCIGLAQTTINQINAISPNAKLFLATGQYDNPNVGNGLILNGGQSIFGRTQNYLQLLNGNQRPLLNDTLFLSGNNIVSHLRVIGQSDALSNRAGLTINESAMGSIQIEYSDISAMTSDTAHSAVAILNLSQSTPVFVSNSTAAAIVNGMDSSAIAVLNKGQLTITNSVLSGIGTTTNTVGTGLFNEDFGVIKVLQSTINVASPTFASGIFNEDFGSIYFINSTINTSSPTFAVGTFNEDFGAVNFFNSTITANSSTLAEGIFNEDFATSSIANSKIIANSANEAVSVFNQDLGRINFLNSVAIAQSGTSAVALSNNDFGIIKIANSSMSVNGTGTLSPLEGPSGRFIFLGINQCYVNGNWRLCA